MNFKAILTLLSIFTVSLMMNAQSTVELTGSGATFPEPLYKKMFDDYNKKTGVKVNYQGIGSGGGISQLTSKVTDFGATDAFMSADELKTAGAEIIHIPTCIGAVVITYNLPGVTEKIKMTPDLIADIFLGKITKWNDPKIAAENKGIKLPNLAISTVHRSDSSGTTYVFTDYLTKVNKEWKEKIGTNKTPNWPAGIGGKGNPGVADLVTKVPGGVGYVELIYALQNKMAYADVKNKSGNFITPSLKTASIAANITIPDDTRVSITDTDAKDGYPISTFTWLILFAEQNYNNRKVEAATAVVNMMWWLIHEGQANNEQLNYATLPAAAVVKAEKLLKQVAFNGKPILK
jgi:phosphate transport system substrate-binding protein